ncbi:vWA domain-containing protein [Dactylosporangium sp. NPDC005572]|uniref:vWA domain-containing protein n=1 Tax=Dactylosporangium sp. NPDC005572 TaxID=3156889 RepID=UPI0033B34A4A
MPYPSSHLHPEPFTAAHPDWAEWDRAWTRHIAKLTGRTDLTVIVAPGAGGGAPACFYPATGRVEVDAIHIGAPDATNPRRAAHKKLVPTAYGLLVHEAAHATHSRWSTPPGTPAVVVAVADLLEESRAEGRQRARRRGDRRWLRHTVQTLITPEDAPVDDAWHAAQLAGLLLARADARILTGKDVKAVRAAAAGVLGRKLLTQLRDIWRQAHTVDDTDAQTMMDLAWRWCRLLSIDPTRQPDTPTADEGAFAGALADAIGDFLAIAAGLTPAAYAAHRIAEQHGAPASWTLRDPTDAEQHAARRLAARLRQARTSSLEPATRPSAIPPGRLRARAAITADAQRTAGQIPSAQPWQQRATLPPHKPALRLAVLVDVSGSMTAFAEPMSSAAWILANAARRTDATVATIAFGETVTLLVPPHHKPAQVQQMQVHDSYERFTDAVKLADHLLQSRHRGHVRMLAVVSDGCFGEHIEPAQRLITTLTRSGCAVLWAYPGNDPFCHTYEHTTTVAVTNPVEAIDIIANAAVTALTQA